MTLSATVATVRNAISELDEDLEFHFWHLDEIVDKLGHLPKISLAYCFSQIEMGYHRILYAGLLRKHRLDPELSWKFVLEHDINRKDFPALFKAIFGHDFPKEIADSMVPAGKVRDMMIHGKGPTTKQMWGAVLKCIEYAAAVNVHLRKREGFSGYGKMQGITGKKGSPTLPKPVTKLALKGIGSRRAEN